MKLVRSGPSSPVESDGHEPPPLLDADLLLGTPSPSSAELEASPVPGIDSPASASRIRRWTGIFAYFFTAQGLVQASGLLAGLLFVNFLSLEEFALYTLASSMLVTLAFLTDLGSSSALLHFFHRSRTEKLDYETFASAVFSLRRRLFLAGAPVVVVAFLIWGGQRQQFTLPLAIAVLCILGASWFQISGSLSVLGLRLADRYAESYRAEVGGSLTRLVLAMGLIAMGWCLALPALATTVAGTVVTAFLSLGGRPQKLIPPARLAEARRAVIRYLAPTLPGALYFAAQGQLVIWLAAAFGGTTSLAQIGALGRLGLLMGLFGTLIPVVFLPRLVRISDEIIFRWRYLQFGTFLTALALLLLASAALAPRPFLMLLGPRYSGLDTELLLVIATSALSLLGGYAVAVNNARSWNRQQPAAVMAQVCFQAAFAALLPLESTSGLLWFGLASAATGLAGQILISALGFWRPATVSWR